MKKVKIVNECYGSLTGLKSANKFGMETEIRYITKDCVGVVEIRKDGTHMTTEIHLCKVSREYIKEKFACLGFDLEFIDTEIIDTFEKFSEFLINNRLAYSGKCDNPFPEIGECGYEIENFLDIGKTEKKYNVKLAILGK